MEKTNYAIPEVKDGPQFSKLESTLVSANPAPRPISKDGQHVFRHRDEKDVNVNELEFDYNVHADKWLLADIGSVHDLFSGVLYHDHVSKDGNFSSETTVECLQVDGQGAEWLNLNQFNFTDLLESAKDRRIQRPASTVPSTSNPYVTTRKTLIFFIPLIPASSGSSHQYKLPLTQSSVDQLFTSLDLNPGFLPNLLGRPDYWAPQVRWEEDEEFLSCDFYCQFPRWNLQTQGAPLSIYSKYDAQRDLTIYLISHKRNDTVVTSLRQLLQPLIEHDSKQHISHLLQEQPFDLLALLCNLNFESSKWHVKRFQRFQWSTVSGVDDFLAGHDQGNRKKLASMLKDLQIVAQNADSHLANAQVFLHAARGVCDMATRLDFVSNKGHIRRRTLNMLAYLIQSMEKQEMWFQNYKGRKENVMNLVFHFNTQTDALNSIELAADMKRDSTNMSAIAGLTMVFLPGTFTASVLSAGIFESRPGQRSFQTTGLWWLWIATTLPITVLTIVFWWQYNNRKLKSMKPVQLILEGQSTTTEAERPILGARKISVTSALRDLVSSSRRKSETV